MNWKKQRYTKLKVGDKVVCIDNPHRRNPTENTEIGYRGGGWEKGFIFIIERIQGAKDEFNGQQIIWGGKDGCGVYSDNVELVI